MKKLLFVLPLVATLAACNDRDVTVVKENLALGADQFEIDRRVVFYNGITDQYMLTIEGKCSVDTNSNGRVFHAVCKVGPREYKHHMLGLSDNVTFFVEHLTPTKASAYHYRVLFKPQTILPDINIDISGSDLSTIVTPR